MARPFGPPPHLENTPTLPSGVTREQRPLRISVSTTEPSAQATGPSGKPSPVARIVTSAMVVVSPFWIFSGTPAERCSAEASDTQSHRVHSPHEAYSLYAERAVEGRRIIADGHSSLQLRGPGLPPPGARPGRGTARRRRRRASSSVSKVPCSTIRPSRARGSGRPSRTVDSRCAMTNVVRPSISRSRPCMIERLGLGVERRRRLVQDQDRRVAQDGARDGDALLLALGQRHAPLADHRVVALAAALR